jgi:predicted thioesterase
VELDHIAATPLGMWVDVSVTVTDMDGRMVSFAVECRDQVEDVARGVHNRFIVGVEKTAARIAKKRAGIG